METKIFDEKLNREELDYIIKKIKEGEIIGFPTETVYGLGGDIFNDRAIKKIYEVKGRPLDNPLIVHIGLMDQASEIGEITDDFLTLGKAFWPGPLSLVVHKKKEFHSIGLCGLDTVAIRIPDNPLVEEILGRGNIYLGAPSANISGKPSPTKYTHVFDDLKGKIFGIMKGVQSLKGIESTILDLTVEPPCILRPGSITKEEIEDVLKKEIRVSNEGNSKGPKAPGMKYQHYAPEGEVFMFKKENLSNLKKEALKNQKKGIFYFSQEIEEAIDFEMFDFKLKNETLVEGIKNYYDFLRKMDKEKVELIYVERKDDEPLGLSFYNRLNKSADGKEI